MKKGFSLFTLCFVFQSLFSQQVETRRKLDSSETNTCTHFGISKPVKELFDSETVFENEAIPEIEQESPDRKQRIFLKDKLSKKSLDEDEDDINVRQTSMGGRNAMVTLTNWAGQTGNFYPPDPTGAAGLSYYVQAVNATPFKVFNKTTGAQVGSIRNIGSLWSPAVTNEGDPIVLYDKYADRWVLCQFKFTSPFAIYIAVSTTSDPTGTFYTYTFPSTEYPDYGKFSIWADGYYMTANENTDKVICFERDSMLAGSASSRTISVNFWADNSGFFVPLFADADGQLPPLGTPCPFFYFHDNNVSGSGSDSIVVGNMVVDWSTVTPTASVSSNFVHLLSSSFNSTGITSPDDIPQPGTTEKLDGLIGFPSFRAQWRKWTGYNSVVINFSVRVTGSQRSIRWYELRQDQSTNAWSIYQQSTFAPDGASRWCGSIAMDGCGNIGLCYAVSDATSIYPSLAFTGRHAIDPLNTMTFAETIAAAGTGSQTGAINRFGDYAHTSIDPADDGTFWHTGEYMGGPTGTLALRTRIYSFQLCNIGIAENTNDASLSAFINSQNSLMIAATNLPVNGNLNVDLFDISGKLIFAKKIIVTQNSFNINFDVSGIAHGVYLLRVGKMNTSFQKVNKLIIK